jgi:hypothetical protein
MTLPTESAAIFGCQPLISLLPLIDAIRQTTHQGKSRESQSAGRCSNRIFAFSDLALVKTAGKSVGPLDEILGLSQLQSHR